MTITYDTGAGGDWPGSGLTVTVSHTVASQSNRVLVVGVAIETASGQSTPVSSITYNAVGLTAIRTTDEIVEGNVFRTELWYLDAPATGTHDIVVTLPTITSLTGCSVMSVGLYDTAQGGPEANNGSVTSVDGTDHDTAVTTITANAWVVDVIGGGSATNWAPDAGQTERHDRILGSQGSAMSTKATTTAGSTNMGWTSSATQSRRTQSAAAWAPSTSGLAISPTGPTVSVTAGTPAVRLSITPTGSTVTATPGTPTLAAANAIAPTGPTVTVTPGTPALSYTQSFAPAGPTVTVTPSTATVSQPGGAVITYDAGSGGDWTAGTTITVSHTVASQTERVLAVGVGIETVGTTGTTVTGITYNAVALTKIRHDETAEGNTFRTELWYLDAPAVGTHNLVVTLDGVTEPGGVNVMAVGLYNAFQGGPEANTGSVTNVDTTDHDTSITTVTADAWVVDVIGGGTATTWVADVGQVERHDRLLASQSSAMSTKLVAPGSSNLGWTSSVNQARRTHSLAAWAPGTGSNAIAPTGPTVTVTPGSVSLLGSTQNFAPTGATVSVTPGTASVNQNIPAPTFIGVTPLVVSTTGTISFDVSAWIAAGRAVVVWLVGRAGSSVTFTPPAPNEGFESIATEAEPNLVVQAWGKVWGLAGQTDNPVFTFSASGLVVDAWGGYAFVVHNTGTVPWNSVLTGGTDPAIVAAGLLENATSTTVAAPAVTVTQEAALVARLFGSANDNALTSASEGVLRAGGADYDTSDGLDFAVALSTLTDTDIVTSTGTATVVHSASIPSISAGVTLVFRSTLPEGAVTRNVLPTATVSVTPGSPLVARVSAWSAPDADTAFLGDVAATGATVSVTAGTLSFTTTGGDLFPAGATVSVTPGNPGFVGGTPAVVDDVVTGTGHRPRVSTTVFAQLRDGTQRVELPQARVRSYGWRLNQPGQCTITIAAEKLPDAAGRLSIAVAEVLEDGVHEIGVRRGGTVVWLGPCLTIDEKFQAGSQPTLEATAEGLASYLWRWYITGQLAGTDAAGHFVGVDQALIAKAFIDHHQAKGGGDYAGLDTSQVVATGVLRDRTEYDAWRGLNIGDAMTNLANVEDGFDWEVRATDRAFVVHYPGQGRRRDNVTLNDSNIIELRRLRDSTRQASSVLGFGDGTDDATIRSTLTDSTAVARYGLTEERWVGSSIITPDVLEGHVAQRLNETKVSPNILAVTVRFTPNLPFGSFGLGDELRILWDRSAWGPIDEWRRVIGIDITPHPDETGTVYLDVLGA